MEALGPQRGVFGVSWGVFWRFSGVLAALLLPLALSRIARMDEWSWLRAAAALASLALVPPLVFGLVAPFAWIYRLRVHELGLHAYDAYGRFHSVRWPSMLAVQPLALLSLPYLRIRTTEAGVELTIPLFLADRDGFERLVAECAGPENPLSRYFATTRERR